MKNPYLVTITYRDDGTETLESMESPVVSSDWVRVYDAEGKQVHIASAAVLKVEISDRRIK